MSRLGSRKLWVTVGALLSVVLTNTVGLPEDAAKSITDAFTVIVGLFLGAQGVADTASALKK